MRKLLILLLVVTAGGCATPQDRAGGGVDGSFCGVWSTVEQLSEPDPHDAVAVRRYAGGVVRALGRLSLSSPRAGGQLLPATVGPDASTVQAGMTALRDGAAADLRAALRAASASNAAADRLSVLFAQCTPEETR